VDAARVNAVPMEGRLHVSACTFIRAAAAPTARFRRAEVLQRFCTAKISSF
jgi:hypothetical protein